MRIAIDASGATEARWTGIGTYIRWLLRELAELDGENQYAICFRLSRLRHRRNFPTIDKPNFRTKIIHEPLNPVFMRRIDLFHGPDTRLPRRTAARRVATWHDVAALVSDTYADERFRRKKLQRYREVADRADRIIAISKSTRDDIVGLFGVEPARVAVVPLGVSDDFSPRPPGEQDAVRRALGLDRDFVLCLGAITRRKNTRRVIQAFAQVARERDVLLVLAGRKGYGWETELAPIEELGLRDRVRLVPHVPAGRLPALYSAARALVFPSLYEGFGIPVLEAMACGTPVVTSNCSSLPEVAGDAALLVDPRDTEAIAEAALRLLDDEALRESLRARGLERARQFPWSRTARQTLQVYREVAGGA